MVEGVRIATPRGEWRLGVAPASAAGPDLRQLVVGSEGAFGVITEVTVRVRELPTVRRYEGFVLDGWDAGMAAVRKLAQGRVLADVTRLSDPHETDVALSLAGGWKTALVRKYLRLRGVHEPCLLVLGWEATSKEELTSRRRATLRSLSGAVSLGTAAGESWRHGRFSGPRQRDALLDRGVCVETLETAAYWANLTDLRTAVRGALIESLSAPGRTPIVACHISHAYETGASLYFTVLVPRVDDDPEGQWRQAKAAACEAIGPFGTITHHHAVGIDHAPYLPREIGTLGVDVLTAVKRELDPDGVCNPGKLLR
jgi:alkyldihydroxyacetonephosphate synthase